MRTRRLWMLSFVLAVAASFVSTGAQEQGTAQTGAPAQPQQQRQFTGTPIDVDYQSANLRNVLRQLSDIGGINLIIDPSVPTSANVDLKLTQVAWDQVLDVLLKTSGLTYEVDGPVIRVMSREARTKELEDQAKQKHASQQAPDLATARVRLNYAAASSVKKLLEQARLISDRGTVDLDERTNMLIVKDIPANLREVEVLLQEIDKPERQVEIEAKIVQTDRNTAKALGVRWGLNGRANPQIGNTTNLAFPNSGSLGGRVTSDQGSAVQGPGPADPRATPLDRTSTAVNMPVAGATSALGLAMGALNGAFNIDVELTALERKGEARVLSTPRVTAQNNKVAEVVQGFEIPIQIVANNTVTVQYKDAALKLLVKPQITAANTVIMEIELENGFPDFGRQVAGNPSINTQRAKTQIQVSDGVTTVIGGILQSREANSLDATPGLSRLPLLGWLFKRTTRTDEATELLIFITPRIL